MMYRTTSSSGSFDSRDGVTKARGVNVNCIVEADRGGGISLLSNIFESEKINDFHKQENHFVTVC